MSLRFLFVSALAFGGIKACDYSIDRYQCDRVEDASNKEMTVGECEAMRNLTDLERAAEAGITVETWDNFRKQMRDGSVQDSSDFSPLLQIEDQLDIEFDDEFTTTYFTESFSSGDELTAGLQYIDHTRSLDEEGFGDRNFARRLYARYEATQEYKDWETTVFENILNRMETDEQLQDILPQLIDRYDFMTEEQALEQWRLREALGQRIYDITAQEFGVESRDFQFISVPDDLPLGGFASWKMQTIVINYNRSVVSGFDSDFTSGNLETIFEEIKHMIDMELAHAYELGTLSEDHPAYDHARVVYANAMDYFTPRSSWDIVGYMAYSDQYVEDNAKNYARRFTRS